MTGVISLLLILSISCVGALQSSTTSSDTGISVWDYSICAIQTLCMLGAAVMLFFVNAPYGKFANDKLAYSSLDIKLDGKIGFAIQEAPSSIVFAIVYFLYWDRVNPLNMVFFVLWEIHYIHRAFIYTFVRQKSCNQTNLSVVLMAFCFTGVNGYLTAKFALFENLEDSFSWTMLLIGIGLFIFGFLLNFQADEILLNLRKPGDKGYYIPLGWPYELVSCPNYLGEIIEWSGLFLAFRTLAGGAFVLNTCANLVPRAVSTHKWYLNKFGEKYPHQRKAIIPFLF